MKNEKNERNFSGCKIKKYFLFQQGSEILLESQKSAVEKTPEKGRRRRRE